MSTLVVIGTALLLAGGAPHDGKRPVPLYTNEDLARVSPRRGDGGPVPDPVSVPAAPEARPDRKEPVDETKTERYWRARARKLEDKLEPLRDQLAEARAQLAEKREEARERRFAGKTKTGGGGGEARLGGRITRLEARIREAEARLADDARRAGALPGWLR